MAERVIASATWHATEALTGAQHLRIEQVEVADNPAFAQMIRVTLYDVNNEQIGGYLMALHPARPAGSHDHDEHVLVRLARPPT